MSRRRVYLHVGTPKSGTSYLQDKLALNRDLLLRHGLDYARTRTGDHFEAALDLIGERWAGEEKKAAGQWQTMVDELGSGPEHVLVSHEILAAAGPESVARARATFRNAEIHVIVTARDLGRQVPAEWQERVKHRGGRPYAAFLDGLHRSYARKDRQTWFWKVQHLPRILETWGAGLPPGRVHLVTVPQADGPRDALWNRFAQVLRLDRRTTYAESETVNASLGGSEVTLLRRLNLELAEREVSRETYVGWVRETVVKEVLAGRAGAQPVTVPPPLRAWVEEIGASWVERIRDSGVDVVGDLADLEPVWPDDDEAWVDPDRPDPEVVGEAAIQALARVLGEVDKPPPPEPRPVSRITRRFRS